MTHLSEASIHVRSFDEYKLKSNCNTARLVQEISPIYQGEAEASNIDKTKPRQSPGQPIVSGWGRSRMCPLPAIYPTSLLTSPSPSFGFSNDTRRLQPARDNPVILLRRRHGALEDQSRSKPSLQHILEPRWQCHRRGLATSLQSTTNILEICRGQRSISFEDRERVAIVVISPSWCPIARLRIGIRITPYIYSTLVHLS